MNAPVCVFMTWIDHLCLIGNHICHKCHAGWMTGSLIKDVAFTVCQHCCEAIVHLMPGVQLIG